MDTLKVLLFPVLQMLPLALRLTPGNRLTEFFNWPSPFIIWKSLRPADATDDQLSPSVYTQIKVKYLDDPKCTQISSMRL